MYMVNVLRWELLLCSFPKALICYFSPLSCSSVLHKVQDLSGEVERMRTNSEISNKQNAWFLQILNSWWCYLARWPSAHSRQSGVAWPDLLSVARLAGGWGEPRRREKGRRDRQKRTRANKIPDACTRNTHKTKLAWTWCPPTPPSPNIKYVKAICFFFLTQVNNNALSIPTGPGESTRLIPNRNKLV